MKHNVSTDTEDMSCHIISNGEFDIFTEGNVCPMSAWDIMAHLICHMTTRNTIYKFTELLLQKVSHNAWFFLLVQWATDLQHNKHAKMLNSKGRTTSCIFRIQIAISVKNEVHCLSTYFSNSLRKWWVRLAVLQPLTLYSSATAIRQWEHSLYIGLLWHYVSLAAGHQQFFCA